MPGVYLSYPFCAQKCTYCNFASGVFPRELEVAIRRRRFARNCARPNGRGRPKRFIWAAARPARWTPMRWQRCSPKSPAANGRKRPWRPRPARSRARKPKRGGRAGINRVSLGVQSFIAKELSRTGRKHTAETVVDDIAMLRDARHREHQSRPDRGLAVSNPRELERIARLDRAARRAARIGLHARSRRR